MDQRTSDGNGRIFWNGVKKVAPYALVLTVGFGLGCLGYANREKIVDFAGDILMGNKPPVYVM